MRAQVNHLVNLRDTAGVSLTAGRAILAAGTFITLLTNNASTLFHDPSVTALQPKCGSVTSFGLFCVTADAPDVGRFIGIAICMVVIAGLSPAITTPLYWYVAASVFFNVRPIDGGDQLTAALAFYLSIICITDRRVWGWRLRCDIPRRSVYFPFANIIWWLIPLQVSFVYLNSAIAKFSAPIWVEGTALWYWIQHPGFNARPGELRIGLDLLANPFFAAATAWGTIALEIFLAVVILLGGRHRNVRLAAIIVGALFHLAIAVAIGLVSFFFAMLGGLTLALWRPRDAVPWSCVSRRSTIRRKVLNAE